jgi:hypothetical protein
MSGAGLSSFGFKMTVGAGFRGEGLGSECMTTTVFLYCDEDFVELPGNGGGRQRTYQMTMEHMPCDQGCDVNFSSIKY